MAIAHQQESGRDQKDASDMYILSIIQAIHLYFVFVHLLRSGFKVGVLTISSLVISSETGFERHLLECVPLQELLFVVLCLSMPIINASSEGIMQIYLGVFLETELLSQVMRHMVQLFPYQG